MRLCVAVTLTLLIFFAQMVVIYVTEVFGLPWTPLTVGAIWAFAFVVGVILLFWPEEKEDTMRDRGNSRVIKRAYYLSDPNLREAMRFCGVGIPKVASAKKRRGWRVEER